MTYSQSLLIGIALSLAGIPSQTAPAGQPVQPERALFPQTLDAVPLPSSAKVEEAVTRYLEGLTARREHDILSREDVVPLFDVLLDIGWEVDPSTRAAIEKGCLVQSDWLVQTLRTPKGMQFMREMSAFPGGYDRLDRMRQHPQGKKELQGLIDSPGGARLIEYLTTTKQGRKTGSHVPSGPGGAKFNTPTNRLYTKADVARQIRLSYAAEVERQLQATSVHRRSTNATLAAPEPPPQQAPLAEPERSFPDER